MDAGKTAEQGAVLIRVLARGVTAALEAGRGGLTSTIDEAARLAGDALDGIRDAGDDAISYLNPGPWLEEIYAFLGIASASSIFELDDRVDDVELKVEEVARKRAREELLLLQQRIGELESVLSHMGEGERYEAMSGLVERLSELESRIDALPWRHLSHDQRSHP